MLFEYLYLYNTLSCYTRRNEGCFVNQYYLNIILFARGSIPFFALLAKYLFLRFQNNYH